MASGLDRAIKKCETSSRGEHRNRVGENPLVHKCGFYNWPILRDFLEGMLIAFRCHDSPYERRGFFAFVSLATSRKWSLFLGILLDLRANTLESRGLKEELRNQL